MAMTTKGPYYSNDDQTPDVPSAGGDYGGHPTPHSAVADQHPFEAPSSMPTGNPSEPTCAGLAAIDTPPRVTRPGKA